MGSHEPTRTTIAGSARLLRALLEFGASERALAKENALGFPARPAARDRIRHAIRANTRTGSARRNIAAHYDLGNDFFYALWLDRGMNYSSALFTEYGQTLEQAQDAKLSRIVELLDVQAGQRILEIGCSWEPLAERLAGDAGMQRNRRDLVVRAALILLRRDFTAERPPKNWDLRLQDYRDHRRAATSSHL